MHFIPLRMFGDVITMDVMEHMLAKELESESPRRQRDAAAWQAPDDGAGHERGGPVAGGEPSSARLAELRDELAMHRGIYARLGLHAASRRSGLFGRGKPLKGYMELQVRALPLRPVAVRNMASCSS